jgi:hypothetical protein
MIKMMCRWEDWTLRMWYRYSKLPMIQVMFDAERKMQRRSMRW